MNVYGVVEIQLHKFLTSALDGDERSASRPGRFIPRENYLIPIGYIQT